MEIFIGTRQVEQCRSHHQKMEKKYFNFISIISNLREIHYATQDTALMKHQLQSNNIQIVDNLAIIQQLKTHKKQEDETEAIPLKKSTCVRYPKQEKLSRKVKSFQPQEKLQLIENAEQYKKRQIQENYEPVKMFEQSSNNFGKIIMYYQKDDNSFIFQSMFQN